MLETSITDDEKELIKEHEKDAKNFKRKNKKKTLSEMNLDF
jgi:hypothetical protein